MPTKISKGEESLGKSIPNDTAHAVSVSLPTWRCNVGYEEGEQWVLSKLTSGYPRFFVQKSITDLAALVLKRHGLPGEACILFPREAASTRFVDFVRVHGNETDASSIRILNFAVSSEGAKNTQSCLPQFSAAMHPAGCANLAKTFWQHTGEGISSRRATTCKAMMDEGCFDNTCNTEKVSKQNKGPKRYRQSKGQGHNDDRDGVNSEVLSNNINSTDDGCGQSRFVEERYGRNLNLEFAEQAKLAIRRRISGSLLSNTDLHVALNSPTVGGQGRGHTSLSPGDVYLYSCGMNSIYNAHRTLVSAFESPSPTICYGFPYIDTLKVLQKFHPTGCLFYGRGDGADLDDLERRLIAGEHFLALFCEFPSNPLLRTPDLHRIRELANQYDFLVVVDETIGNFLNVDTLPLADVLVSSLTKIFSGDSNVMGGSAILNPESRYYRLLKSAWDREYEDNYWPEDAIVMERNSRDFISRVARINDNAQAIVQRLEGHPRIKDVYYPTTSDTRRFYDACKTQSGGYGGLLSVVFHDTNDAARFYDSLDLAKGPSLGTNFTLASPFVLLAHYGELKWAEGLGVPVALIRFSVGLEEPERLLKIVDVALEVFEERHV